MKNLAIGSIALLCTACGTFKLADGFYPPAGKTPEQQQLDALTCKDEASLATQGTGNQIGDFLLGMTIIGARWRLKRTRTSSAPRSGSA